MLNTTSPVTPIGIPADVPDLFPSLNSNKNLSNPQPSTPHLYTRLRQLTYRLLSTNHLVTTKKSSRVSFLNVHSSNLQAAAQWCEMSSPSLTATSLATTFSCTDQDNRQIISISCITTLRITNNGPSLFCTTNQPFHSAQ